MGWGYGVTGMLRARICKSLWSPDIDSEELITPGWALIPGREGVGEKPNQAIARKQAWSSVNRSIFFVLFVAGGASSHFEMYVYPSLSYPQFLYSREYWMLYR